MTCHNCQTTFKVGVVYDSKKKQKTFCFTCSRELLRTIAPDLVRNYTQKLTDELTNTTQRTLNRFLDGFKH